jgi:peptide/nickel transport system substrate-binding protein
MRHSRIAPVAALAAAALVAAGCGKAQKDTSTTPPTSTATAESALDLSPTTPAGTGSVDHVAWATYRPVQTVDPIQAYDYPDNTAVTLMCESLLRQAPDGSIGPGLATASHPDPKTLVLTLDPKATFWDGQPVTAADALYSLQRNVDPKRGGFYGTVFSNVASMSATGPDEVTIKLKQPDYWLDGELSQMPGVVVEKAFAEKAGKAFGTPAGGTMCTGAYQLDDWKGGDVLRVKPNAGYWGDHKAQVQSLELRGISDEATLTSGLLTGEVDGYYSPGPLGTVKQLADSDKVTLYEGPSFATDALAISATKGPLADARVRRALSLAMDRQAYINSSYKGNALLPRTLANPGTWGYGRGVFEADWDKLPQPDQDVDAAKRLVEEAGAAGQTITIGTSEEIPSIASAVTTVRGAAEAIGLTVKLKSVSAANYINFFIDPKAFGSVDGFPTVNYPDYADPAAFYATFALPGGSQNFSGYENPVVTKALTQARQTADPDARAKLVVQAGDQLMQDLPWIPLVSPTTVLLMSNGITGAPSSFSYMGAPWADTLGTKG